MDWNLRAHLVCLILGRFDGQIRVSEGAFICNSLESTHNVFANSLKAAVLIFIRILKVFENTVQKNSDQKISATMQEKNDL